jgi:hypothetical protein
MLPSKRQTILLTNKNNVRETKTAVKLYAYSCETECVALEVRKNEEKLKK